MIILTDVLFGLFLDFTQEFGFRQSCHFHMKRKGNEFTSLGEEDGLSMPSILFCFLIRDFIQEDEDRGKTYLKGL